VCTLIGEIVSNGTFYVLEGRYVAQYVAEKVVHEGWSASASALLIAILWVVIPFLFGLCGSACVIHYYERRESTKGSEPICRG